MYSDLIVGAPRQGKSNYIKALLWGAKRKPCYVYDPKNEYGLTYQTWINEKRVTVPGIGLIANNPKEMRSRYTGTAAGIDPDYFLKIVMQKRSSIIGIDEATSVLKGQLSKEWNLALTGRAHSANSFLFIFHSLLTIPPDIIRNSSCDRIILFRTLDNASDVKAKFGSELLNIGFEMQKKKGNKAPPTIIYLTEGEIDGKQYN